MARSFAHAEVGNAGTGVLRVVDPEPAGFAHVPAQIHQSPVEMSQEGGVRRRVFQPVSRDTAEKQDRIASTSFQYLRVEVLEQLVGARIPCPAEVVGQLLQPVQAGGDMGIDPELMDLTHGRHYPTGPRTHERASDGWGRTSPLRRDRT
jgi:hypothetical protein